MNPSESYKLVTKKNSTGFVLLKLWKDTNSVLKLLILNSCRISLRSNSLVLTPTALEVLAIIAYKQPVSKNDAKNQGGFISTSSSARLWINVLLRFLVALKETDVRHFSSPDLKSSLKSSNFADILQLYHLSMSLKKWRRRNAIGTIADIKLSKFKV